MNDYDRFVYQHINEFNMLMFIFAHGLDKKDTSIDSIPIVDYQFLTKRINVYNLIDRYNWVFKTAGWKALRLVYSKDNTL